MKVTKQFHFSAAHRIVGHQGKCAYLHGHNYVAEVTVSSPKLNNLGMVMDFSVIKEVCGFFIEKNWDHNILLWLEDPLAELWNTLSEEKRNKIFGTHPCWFSNNPTAEVMAMELFAVTQASYRINSSVIVENVRIYETPTSWADYGKEDV